MNRIFLHNMKNILHIKGIITDLDPEFIYVKDSKTDDEYRFYFSAIKDCKIGDKIDALIAPAYSEDSVSKILSLKETKKAKPIKMPSFSTLLGHIIKTKERLKANLEIEEDPASIADLKEKIDWLEKGVLLFR